MATAAQELASGEVEDAEPYDEQRPFMGLDKRFYGFVSGTGAGKTFAGAYRLWLNTEWWNPNSMGAIIVPDKSQFTDNIKPILEEFGLVGDGDDGLWDYQSVYTDEPGLHTHNDQRILILSADNTRQIGRIKGKNLGFAWMDEEAEIDPRAREIAQQRLRVGQYPNLFITTTPDGYNHTYDFFEGDVDVRKHQHGQATIYEADDRLAVVGVPPEANPEIRDEDIANMRESLPDAIVQQEIEGQFVQVAGGVFRRDMFQYENPDKVSGRVEPVITVDPAATSDAMAAEANDSDFWAMTVGLVHPQGYMYVLDSSQDRGMTLHEGCEWIERRVRYTSDSVGKRPSLLVEANQAQQFLVDELAERGLQVQPINTSQSKEDKIIDMSIPITNGRVKFLSYEDGRYDDLRNQLLAWPEVQHDDLIDSLSMLVKHAPVPTRIHSGEYNERDLW